ncbi:hypothetical protein LSCM1_04933 [Leishmania martiniquensis]|uniref:Uncharacterized protein n=1 Tax=Leishmania martiniquensis TaxID=1580590 RepID=A0A836HUY8_9TRYP|nr:hypothetical protein LSCM1_04933 [Leishmania martiniquensis]
MPISRLPETAVSSSHPLDLEDDSGAAGTLNSAASTVPLRSSKKSASVTSHHTTTDKEAVELDPAALWAALDLPAPESIPSQHTSRRVVLLGRPLSGKRALCRRLCFAAEAQYAGTDEAAEGDRQRGAVSADNDRQPLYHPRSDDDDDAALFSSQHLGGCDMRGAYSTGDAPPPGGAVGPRDRANPLSHGSGVCFDYVVQRVPTRLAHGSGDPAPVNTRATTGFLSTPLCGTVRRTTEFFCCDNAGALTMALPSLDHVESALVLMVIDVSDVSTIRQQLNYCYSTLDSYVANLLRSQAPNHDEVRRMQLAAAQQDYWLAEEEKLRTMRTNLANSSSSSGAVAASSASVLSKEGGSDVPFKDPAVNIDKVNSTSYRVPASAGMVCTMRSAIVCTRIEVLDRASRAIGSTESGTPENEALLDRLGIPSELRVAMRHSRQSLLRLVSQLLRQYAICHRAALVSVSSHVSMTTAGAEGDYASSALVNPFFKGLWAYIAYVLYSSKEASASVPSDVLRVCSARMYPHALLPFGLDSLALLNHFVTSSSIQLPEGPSLTSPEDPSDSAIRTTAEGVITPDGIFSLHQKYIQQAQTDLTSSLPLWATPEEFAQSGEAMVWDCM